MNKTEFEYEVSKLSGDNTFSITDDFNIISYVYTFYPSISDTKGKIQIAYLYHNFGMRLIKDMYPTAAIMADLELERDEINNKIIRFRNGENVQI